MGVGRRNFCREQRGLGAEITRKGKVRRGRLTYFDIFTTTFGVFGVFPADLTSTASTRVLSNERR
jgi:hypothetical protein